MPMKILGILGLLPALLAELKKIIDNIGPLIKQMRSLIEQMKGLATKDDLKTSTAELRGEISDAANKLATKEDFAGVKPEIANLRAEKTSTAELHGEISDAVNKLATKEDFAGVKSEIANLRAALNRTALISVGVILGGLALAVTILTIVLS